MRKMCLTYIAIFVGVIIGVCLFACYQQMVDPLADLANSGYLSGTHVGQKKGDLLRRFGQPSDEKPGIPRHPAVEFTQAHPTAVTLIYYRSTGVLYLTFEKIDDEWICFSSDWYSNNCGI
jgi:hypothetical protein